MNKHLICLAFTAIVALTGVVSAGTYSGGGNGTAEQPYRIATPADMNNIGNHIEDFNKCFVLVNDIDLAEYTGTEFNIIGTFTGVFDGNGHTISNFTYETADEGGIGLFGYVDDANALIKDLHLTDPNVVAGEGSSVGSLVGVVENGTITGCSVTDGNISGRDFVGGLVGRKLDGTISNCSTSGTVSGENIVIGGLIGDNRYGTISACHSSASVFGRVGAGGLVGFNYGGLIASNCYSTGSVEGSDMSVGGLVGSNANGGTIKNCYSTSEVLTSGDYAGGLVGNSDGPIENCYCTGSVSGNDRVGGLVGNNRVSIKNCYSVGEVLGTPNVGGLVGYEDGGTVSASFWDVNTSGEPNSAGGEGKTTAEMQTMSTFTDAGWDFVGETVNGERDIWTISEGNYPELTPQAVYYGGGYGSAANPYQIWTRDDMNEIGTNPEDWDRHFILMADVNLASYTGTQFNIIGNGNPFTGVFDGNGHTISNFTYETADAYEIGLFGCAGIGAVIKDLKLADPNVDAGASSGVGSLVGQVEGGRISGCSVEGGSVSGYNLVGGLIGTSYFNHYPYSGTVTDCCAVTRVSGNYSVGGLMGDNDWGSPVTDCCASGEVSGPMYVGGLLGTNGGIVSNCHTSGSLSYLNSDNVGGLVGNNDGIIQNCYSTALIRIKYYDYVGGLVGRNGWDCTVENCYFTGGIITDSSGDVGGLVGNNYGTVKNCYVTCSMSCHSGYAGGLVGRNWDGTIEDCYANIETGGAEVVGGLAGYNNDTISNCYAGGTVSGWKTIGGLAGSNHKTISNCYATAAVSGWGTIEGQKVGGLVGGNTDRIENCYAAGNVTGGEYTGGLVGYDSSGAYTSCFWDSDVNPDVNGIGNTDDPNVIGKTTAEMKTESTFTDAGWDFVGEVVNGPNDIWDICEAMNYPKFVWQIPVGDFVCPDGVNFADYAFFSDHWGDEPCDELNNYCNGADLDQSGAVDINDLKILGDNWLEGL